MDRPEESTPIVLIADDDALVRRVLCLALSRAGFRTLEAGNAREAIDAEAEHDPELIVLDINMPGAGVDETLKALRSRTPHLPVLVLSGHAAPPDEMVGPITDFARKPIDFDEFLTRVYRLLDRARETT